MPWRRHATASPQVALAHMLGRCSAGDVRWRRVDGRYRPMAGASDNITAWHRRHGLCRWLAPRGLRRPDPPAWLAPAMGRACCGPVAYALGCADAIACAGALACAGDKQGMRGHDGLQGSHGPNPCRGACSSPMAYAMACADMMACANHMAYNDMPRPSPGGVADGRRDVRRAMRPRGARARARHLLDRRSAAPPDHGSCAATRRSLCAWLARCLGAPEVGSEGRRTRRSEMCGLGSGEDKSWRCTGVVLVLQRKCAGVV